MSDQRAWPARNITGTVQMRIASDVAAAPKSRPKMISMIGMAASETASAPPIVSQAVARKELRMSAASASALSRATRDAVA